MTEAQQKVLDFIGAGKYTEQIANEFGDVTAEIAALLNRRLIRIEWIEADGKRIKIYRATDDGLLAMSPSKR